MVGVAQLVRAPDCGSGGRGFETRHSPHTNAQRSDRLTETINHALASSLDSSGLTNTLRVCGVNGSGWLPA